MINIAEILFVIPARGGSKGLLGKNIKPLAGKPLIHYSIDYARIFTTDENICLSTDDESIIDCAQKVGLNVPFIRPAELATDTSSTFSVLHHAIKHYFAKNKGYNWLVLLQPTSPFRAQKHLSEMIHLADNETDAVVSVSIPKHNPYFNLFEENGNGFLEISKGNGSFTSRQQVPHVYAFDGSIYIFKVESLLAAENFSQLKKIKKYIIEDQYSTDIDTLSDWENAEKKLFLR